MSILDHPFGRPVAAILCAAVVAAPIRAQAAIDIHVLFNEQLPKQLAKFPDRARAIGGKFQFDITGDGGGDWFVDVSNTGPSVKEGHGANPDVTVTLSADDFRKLQESPQAGAEIIRSGRVKIVGNAMLAQQFGKIFQLGS